jgi:hypothetical protein
MISIWCGMILALCIIRDYIFNFACLTMIYCFLVPLFPCNKYWYPCWFSYLYNVHHVCCSWQTHSFVPSFFTNINPLNSDKFALGSKWNSTSQWLYVGLRTLSFWRLPFVKKHFSNEIFCKFLFIIFTIAPICHMFCVNQFLINIYFFEMHKFCKILHFILNMVTIHTKTFWHFKL